MNAIIKIKPNEATPANGGKTFAQAFAQLQAEIKPAIKDATNPAFRSKYADLGAVWEAIKVPLGLNGFSVIQSPNFEGEQMWLETMILHTSGECLTGRYPIKPVKSDPQGVGSAITYARRYSLSAMLGVIADDDDDGNAASANNRGSFVPTGKITETQLNTLTELLMKFDADIPKFCTHFKIKAVPDLPADKYSTAIEMLNHKGAAK